MKYSEFLQDLQGYAESDFAAFQRKLIPTQQQILGIRTPTMRRLAKLWREKLPEIFAFPDEVYEVTFLKLTMVSSLEYDEFLRYVNDCVAKIDNWATCDSFKAKTIGKHREEFLPVLEKLFLHGGEFYERYVLVSLLSWYVDDRYLDTIAHYLTRADTSCYYVHMATAWLTAEIIIKEYNYGIDILKQGVLDAKTHNKAIQKAIESYRLNKEQKDYLRSLKK